MGQAFNNTTPRGAGTTKECFNHLVGTVPHLPMLKLIAEHCGAADVSVAQAWQRGDYFPKGLQEVKLRCLLDCANYYVSELNVLGGPSRQLAMMVGMSMIDLGVVKRLISSKSKSAQGALRIVSEGGGTSEQGRKAIETFVRNSNRRKQLTDLTSVLSDKLDALFDEYAPHSAPAETSPSVPATLDPALPVAFASMATTLVSLGFALQRVDGGPDAIRVATNNWQGLAQLQALLEELMQHP